MSGPSANGSTLRDEVRSPADYHRPPTPGNTIMAQANPGRRLRQAWAHGAIQVPGVYNPLVARLAEEAGFPAVYLSGAALSASLGLPDVGLVTLNEFIA